MALLETRVATDLDDTILAEAHRVIQLEAHGVASVSSTLDQAFVAVVKKINNLKGRVIITGVGKSSHVGRKLAATLASTGTPSYFVHAGEASHGDLGMIAPEDIVIAISNSGEAPELAHVINYVGRFTIPLVAITKNPQSSLGLAADYVLNLPDVEEACSLGMAPTTSTTATMALGDALAVCLLNVKSFSKHDFGVLHPGGRLGQMLLKLEQVMHKGDELPICVTGTSMRDGILEMTTKRLGCLGIVDSQGALSGMITDGDLRRHLDGNLFDHKVEEIMTPNPSVLYADQLASEALGFMNEKRITNSFVVDQKTRKPTGVVHIHDLLKFGV